MKTGCIAAALVLFLLLAACSPGGAGGSSIPSQGTTAAPVDAAVPDTPTNSPQKLSIQGSTSVAPLMERLVDAFVAENGDIQCEVQGTGSSAGLKATMDGTAHIGMSSRALREEEAAHLTAVTIALDGIAVVVHPDNPVKALTREQISSIFQGEIVNWSALGGEDAPIVLVSREAGSGTRGAFEEIMRLESAVDGKTFSLVDLAGPLIATGNGEIKQNIATKKNAIGYLSLGSVDDSLRALEVDGVQATAQNVKNETYPIARPFLLVTKGAPSESAQRLIDLILSGDGQTVVEEMGYISVGAQ